jgi:hypothetical protein
LLERKWPEKYNAFGHPTWGGRIYAKGVPQTLGFRRPRIYQGPWGSAPYQSLEHPAPPLASLLPLMPEWYLVIAALAVISALGILWRPLLLALPLLALSLIVPALQAGLAARQAVFESQPRSKIDSLRARGLTAFLHLAQPLARLWGRMEYGLTFWRAPVTWRVWMILPRKYVLWNERWRSATAWLEALEQSLRENGAVVARGGDYDSWDLNVRSGALGSARSVMLIEEHGAGRQLVRFRAWPVCSSGATAGILGLSALAAAAGFDGAWAACAVLGVCALGVVTRTAQECAAAMARIEIGRAHV